MSTNNQLSKLVVELFDTRQKRAELEKLEKAIVEALKPLVDPKFDALPGKPIVVDDIQFSRNAGVNRSISSDLLLERGVAPNIIAFATKTTPYFRYLTNKPKAKKVS